MGIVASCPQGHRVKVKDHLAGRKGICPECGTRFRIPLQASPAGERTPAAGATPVASDAGTPAAGTPLARFVSLDAVLAATLPRALPLALPGESEPG